MKDGAEVLLVGFDYKEGIDQAILVVAKRVQKTGPYNIPVMEQHIINTFKGDEAKELYTKLLGENK